MTAQADTLRLCREKLGEHFDEFLVVAVKRGEDGRPGSIDMTLGDSVHAALGLAERAKDLIIHGFTPDEIEGDPADGEGKEEGQ